MTASITYNSDEMLFEVSLSRARLRALIDRGIYTMRDASDGGGPTCSFAQIEALRKVGRNADRVLACATKRDKADKKCGCPAILAQVNCGVDYNLAHLNGGYTSFANGFDRAVMSYIEGLTDAGVKHNGPSFSSPASYPIRLVVVTGEDS